jgi:hypothetical protein
VASVPPWDLERREGGAAHDGAVGAALQAAGDLVGFDRDLALVLMKRRQIVSGVTLS